MISVGVLTLVNALESTGQDVRRRGVMDYVHESSNTATILLVDDDPDHLIITRRFLESRGFTCICALRGHEALQALNEQPVDLVLLDLHMPGMDGYCLAQNIRARERFRSIPIVAFSADDCTALKQRAMEAGLADFLPKPVDRHLLIAAVRDQLSLRQRWWQLRAVEEGLAAAPTGTGIWAGGSKQKESSSPTSPNSPLIS